MFETVDIIILPPTNLIIDPKKVTTSPAYPITKGFTGRSSFMIKTNKVNGL
ncbi:MAG: hypothetical protein ACQPRJ_01940 [Solitalea-like symbiont of Acarus siro]